MILISGATGRISKAVIHELRSRSLPIRVLAPGLPNPKAFGLDVEVVTREPAQPDEWQEVFEDITALYCSTPGGPEQVKLQLNTLQAAKRMGIERIVKISNFGAAPDSPLAQTRLNWRIEQEILETGIPYTFLRPRFLMQNFLMVFAPGIKARSSFSAPAGEGRIPYVDLRDVAEVAVAVLTQAGHAKRTYELTGPEALTCEAVAGRFSTALNRPVHFEDAAPEAALQVFAKLGLPPQMASDIAAMFAAVRTAEPQEPTAVIAEITRKPARTLDQFISENLAAFSG